MNASERLSLMNDAWALLRRHARTQTARAEIVAPFLARLETAVDADADAIRADGLVSPEDIAMGLLRARGGNVWALHNVASLLYAVSERADSLSA